jgi:hypothetical protein
MDAFMAITAGEEFGADETPETLGLYGGRLTIVFYPARQATFDFGDKNRQMQSSDVVSCRQLTSLNFRSFPGRHEGSLKCRHMSSHGS